MKTDILKIEQHDDLITILDKIGWCKSDRILLVFPKIIRKPLNLVELTRLVHATSGLGAQIAIVTTSAILSSKAKEVGIQAFPTEFIAQRSHWVKSINGDHLIKLQGYEEILKQKPGSQQNKSLKSKTTKINILLMGIVFFAILGMAAFIFPSVTLRIYPQTRTQSIEVQLTASGEVSAPNITGMIPAYKEEIILSGTKSKESTSSAAIPLLKAQGGVFLKNLANEIIELSVGTLLQGEANPELEFTTIEPVELLPGASTQFVKVEALTPGVNGNISSSQPLVITGDSATNIIVESHTDFIGGTESIVPAPGETDYLELKNTLIEELTQQAEEQIGEASANMIPGSIQVAEVIDERLVYPVGVPSAFAELSLTIRFKYLTYQSADIEWIGTQLMDQEVPVGTEPVANTLLITNIDSPQFEGDVAAWKVMIVRDVHQKYDYGILKQRLKGLKIGTGIEYLNSEIDHYQSAELREGFLVWKWLPLFSERINLEEVYESEG